MALPIRTGRWPGARRPEIPFPALIGPADTPWLEPYPDDLFGDVEGSADGPETRYEARESLSLAFVGRAASTFRRGSVPPWCSATCSGSPPRRPP